MMYETLNRVNEVDLTIDFIFIYRLIVSEKLFEACEVLTVKLVGYNDPLRLKREVNDRNS